MNSNRPVPSSLITQLANELVGINSIIDVLWIIAERVQHYVGLDDCVIYLVEDWNPSDLHRMQYGGSQKTFESLNARSKVLVQRTAFGPKNPAPKILDRPIFFSLEEGIVGRAAREQKPQRVGRVDQDPHYLEDTAQAGSELAVPILFKGQTLGVIDSEHSEPDYYTAYHEACLMAITSVSAAFIVNAQTTERLRRASNKFEYDATHDFLTGLGNRRALSQAYRSRQKNRRTPFTLMFTDIVKFKRINDQFGHHGGDRLLRGFGQLLRTLPKNEGQVFRLGGDEFAIIFESADQAHVEAMCLRLQRQCRRKFDWVINNERKQLLNIGLLNVSDPKISYTKALAMADIACLEARSSHQSMPVWYDKIRKKHLEMQQQEAFLGWFREAMSAPMGESDLRLFAQPIVPCQHGSADTKHHEILIRMGRGKNDSPRPYINLIEQSGLCQRLDEWVIDGLLFWLERLDKSDRSKLGRLSVNLCPASICDDSFTNDLIARLKSLPQDISQQLTFEITENMSLDDLMSANTHIRKIRKLGCMFALDDFGSGHTSLNYLRKLDVEFLKIDGSFVTNAQHNPRSRAILMSINKLAHTLNMKTIAEYVRDKDTWKMVRDIGVDYGQGYYVSRPKPLETILLQLVGTEAQTTPSCNARSPAPEGTPAP